MEGIRRKSHLFHVVAYGRSVTDWEMRSNDNVAEAAVKDIEESNTLTDALKGQGSVSSIVESAPPPTFANRHRLSNFRVMILRTTVKINASSDAFYSKLDHSEKMRGKHT